MISFAALFVVFGTFVLVFPINCPSLYTDNESLQRFLEEGMLSFLGLVTTVTAASTAHLNVRLTRIEEQFGKPGALEGPRKAINHRAISLIALFFVAVLSVIVKGAMASAVVVFLDGILLTVFVVNMVILTDVTLATFTAGSFSVEGKNNLENGQKT